jgi:excisionase family DNA binding protein
MPSTASRPVLLTLPQAAALLNVSDRTIRRWLKADKIPYVQLPGGDYRIPQGALLASLRGNYDLAAELEALEARHGRLSESDVAAALGDD